MEKLVIYKNKGDNFKCQFAVDGVEAKDIEVRLCLEFGDNKNFFFYGAINESGECNIQIPKLTELDSKIGKLSVEAIADSTYFKVYECEVSLKNSVDIKMKPKGSFFDQKESSIKETKIQLSNIERVTKEEVVEEPESEEKPNPFLVKKENSEPRVKPNPFLTKKDEPVKESASAKFSNYLKSRR